MPDSRAEVRNAADAVEVKSARQRVKHREERYRAALQAVLETSAGRLVFGELEHGLIARAGVYRAEFKSSGSEVFFDLGRRNFGLELLARIQEFETLYLLMETECRTLAKRDAAITTGQQAARDAAEESTK